MKTLLKKIAKEERGQVFLLALVLLVVGGLVITPLLNYMNTGLNAGTLFQNETDELYAADAGVEDAIWQIQHEGAGIEDTTTAEVYGITLYGLPPYSVDHDDDPGTPNITYYSGTYSIADVNGKSVEITLQYIDSTVWQIFSTSTSSDGSSTTLEVLTNDITADYSGILDNVITTPGTIDFPPHWEDLVDPPSGENGPVEGYTGDWPDTSKEIADLIKFYWWQVDDPANEYSSSILNLNGVNLSKGPLYRIGTLDILNSNNTNATLTLDGTVYVSGQTKIGNTAKDFTLDLNGNTIFVESNLTGGGTSGTALWIGGQCTIVGPGVIIAIGDVYFAPNIEAGMEEPIFIMSVTGTTTLQPGGNFYGSVAGDVEVDLQPGTSITYPEGGFEGLNINFPGMVTGAFWGVLSWKIN